MSTKTGIEWTDSTWNPIRGCSRVSEGCRHCYAEVVAARFSGPGQAYEGLARRTSKGEARWTGKIAFVEKHLEDPLRWKEPRRIFVNSMSDLFHEGVTDEQLDQIFAVMALSPKHTFQVLTKRPERMRDYFAGDQLAERIDAFVESIAFERTDPHNRRTDDLRAVAQDVMGDDWPLPNVWLGTSVENQAAADERIPILLQTPAAVRFLSCEPLLGALDLDNPLNRMEFSHDTGKEAIYKPSLNWVIVGGESGTDARPCDVAWIRQIVAQCAEYAVPCFVKQMGKWITGDHTAGDRTGFDASFVVNRWLLDDGRVFVPPIIGARAKDKPENAIAFGLGDTHGGSWIEWARDLRVREFPAGVAHV